MTGKAVKKGIDAGTLTFSSKEFDSSEYEKTARSARLEEISLVKCNYQMSPSCFYEAAESENSLRQGFSGTMVGFHFDDEMGQIAGGYSWSAEVKSGRRNALSMKAEFLLVYSGLAGIKTDYARLYFQKIARFTSYPFFRSHFAIHTSASGLHLAPLPSLMERVD